MNRGISGLQIEHSLDTKFWILSNAVTSWLIRAKIRHHSTSWGKSRSSRRLNPEINGRDPPDRIKQLDSGIWKEAMEACSNSFRVQDHILIIRDFFSSSANIMLAVMVCNLFLWIPFQKFLERKGLFLWPFPATWTPLSRVDYLVSLKWSKPQRAIWSDIFRFMWNNQY